MFAHHILHLDAMDLSGQYPGQLYVQEICNMFSLERYHALLNTIWHVIYRFSIKSILSLRQQQFLEMNFHSQLCGFPIAEQGKLSSMRTLYYFINHKMRVLKNWISVKKQPWPPKHFHFDHRGFFRTTCPCLIDQRLYDESKLSSTFKWKIPLRTAHESTYKRLNEI